MKKNPKHSHQGEKFLNKTQEVLYQREFKGADKVYNQFTQRGSR
ncbi:YfhE family protein [Lentibacillus sp. N15]